MSAGSQLDDLPRLAGIGESEGDDPGRSAPPAIPRATYRVQFNAEFTFDDAARIVPYLGALGVSHLYASPWLKARKGSPHGYDITDHNAFNPEVGGPAAFERLAERLAGHGIGQILDFVPNHMGIGRTDNEWWLDLLEWGPDSPYAAYFDIDWHPPNRRLRNKVLVPMLGEHYGQVLESGLLVPGFEPATGGFAVGYYQHRFPVALRDYPALIRRGLDAAGDGVAVPDGRAVAELATLADEFAALDRARGVSRRQRVRILAKGLRTRLAALAGAHPEIAAMLAHGVAGLEGKPGDSASFRPLHRLLERQHFRLAYWAVAADDINYRRFFNINELVGIRIENPELFARAHRLVSEQLAAGRLHGLRIDHIDGLYDPAEYCRRLQALPRPPGQAGAPLYVVVEKILARHERLREDWPVAGTTGYEFAAQVNGLFIEARSERAFTRIYERFLARAADFDDMLYEAKKLIIEMELGSELTALANELNRISERHWRHRDYTLQGLRLALAEVVAGFPVYRTYVSPRGIGADDRRDIVWAVSQARRRWTGPGGDILDFVEAALTTDLAAAPRSGYRRAEVLRFAMHFQQFTGPVMAKSVEDTAYYRYHRLVSLNEVGGDPRQFGCSPSAFHHANLERARHWPHAMLATATHDTKRGEDVRARLAVLSEMPAEWGRRVNRWAALNRRGKREIEGRPAPGRNDEYLLYQTLLGAWPIELMDVPEGNGVRARFVERIKAYMIKAAREARQRTSWSNPSAAYEGALTDFIERILDPRTGRPFLNDFAPFQERVARLGVLASLAQLALKLTCPGMPDIYQGTELWDLSLVDPDNRRPVDFTPRARLLAGLAQTASATRDGLEAWMRGLLSFWHDGRVKMQVMATLLRLRRQMPELFADGGYEPLEVAGRRGEHVFAFRRTGAGASVVVAAGRLFASLVAEDAVLPVAEAWGNTALALPEDAAATYTDVLTRRRVTARDGRLAIADLFTALPVAVLVEEGWR